MFVCSGKHRDQGHTYCDSLWYACTSHQTKVSVEGGREGGRGGGGEGGRGGRWILSVGTACHNSSLISIECLVMLL